MGSTVIEPEADSEEKVLSLPANLTTIEAGAFLDVAAEKIVIPAGVSEIGNNAFTAGTILVVVDDSYAERWAIENGYETVFIH